MDTRHFLSASRVLIVAGKGGVGKSTVAAALAQVATGAGLHTLLVEIEGKNPVVGLDQRVERLAITPGAALADYFDSLGLGRVSRRLLAAGIVDLVASTAPGIDDLLILGKIKQLEQTGDWDLIIVDGPPAGQAIGLLRAPLSLRQAVRGGPIHTQAIEILNMLADPARCRVMMVSTPELTPVSELIDTAFEIEDQIGVALGPVVLNGIDDESLPKNGTSNSELNEALLYRRNRQQRHELACALLTQKLPLPQLRLPRLSNSASICLELTPTLESAIATLP
ncbi:MAG: ArsA family ATPase [Actinobacteria bacterium]|nr:ArsA family ATPase [Actinomycetota bacterium]